MRRLGCSHSAYWQLGNGKLTAWIQLCQLLDPGLHMGRSMPRMGNTLCTVEKTDEVDCACIVDVERGRETKNDDGALSSLWDWRRRVGRNEEEGRGEVGGEGERGEVGVGRGAEDKDSVELSVGIVVDDVGLICPRRLGLVERVDGQARAENIGSHRQRRLSISAATSVSKKKSWL